MAKDEMQKPFTDDQFADYITKTFFFALAVALLVVAAYALKFGRMGFSDSTGAWGEFGDYVGGVVNPIVGLVTAFLVLISVSIQRKELRASVEEMKAANASSTKMSFEQSLFAWLANYQSLLADVSSPHADRGRDSLLYWYRQNFHGEVAWRDSARAMTGLATMGASSPKQGFAFMLARPRDPHYQPILEHIFYEAQKGYRRTVDVHRVSLDPVFRTLFRLLQWIDGANLPVSEKWHYVSLVNAQLSWIEQVYVLYYVLGGAPEGHARIVNKYALLDQVDIEDGLIFQITHELTFRPPAIFTGDPQNPKRWPLENSAFDQEIAQENLGLGQTA